MVARDVIGAELAGFRIVGDAATPLGTGVLVERADVSLVDLEVLGAMAAAVELGTRSAGSVVGVDVHDNPGAGLVIRSGASSRISHSGFNKNGMSERTSAPVIVEAGARVRLEQNVFTGITPDVFRTLPPDAAAAALRENWFPGLGIHMPPGRPAKCAASTTASGRTTSTRRSAAAAWPWSSWPPTRTTNQRVALRTVPTYQAPDVLAAEHRGAELQEQFCRVSGFVPQVYKYGTEADYFYVAMEYLDGENLSQAIRRGPLPETRAVAVAVELCRFLEDARGFTWTVEGREVRHLLHGDLTPANVRLTSDGRVKVLDFGIAKALSLSRKVTRNDFGSLAYLSPERIESGGEMDATDGFWALGVMLYEMLKGAPPFSAPDTRRLERVIVSRRPAPHPRRRLPGRTAGVVARAAGPDAGSIAIRAPRPSVTISSATRRARRPRPRSRGGPAGPPTSPRRAGSDRRPRQKSPGAPCRRRCRRSRGPCRCRHGAHRRERGRRRRRRPPRRASRVRSCRPSTDSGDSADDRPGDAPRGRAPRPALRAACGASCAGRWSSSRR